MKKILTLALVLMLVLTLAACGNKTDPAPSGSSENSTTPDSGTSQPNTPGEVADFKVELEGIPAEWQKGIGTEMFGFEANGDSEFSAGYAAKFGSVTQEDYDKLIAYFDTLTYSEKRGTAYFTDFGKVEALHNEKNQEMTVTWWLSK